METKKRIIKALLLGAIIGLTYEFVVDPVINKPLEKKVEEIIK
jgi:hypothetical protein